MPKKTAIILFNLGGPDSLDAVKPFLFNLFSDEAIISLPKPLRFMLAKFISSRRTPIAQDIYKEIGGKSPILEETQKQASALDSLLNSQGGQEYKVFISMRYWHPFAQETINQVKDYSPDEIILLPLYPHYSITTSGSSIKNWFQEAKKQGINNIPTQIVNSYPIENNFIQAHISKLKKHYHMAKEIGPPRVLFSAHGLPKKIIDKGDPYQKQVEQTVSKKVANLEIDNLDWCVCYQSKVGPLQWIGPSTDDEIIRAGKDGVPIVIVPIAFVSEHSETLVELDIEYKKLANKNNVPGYFRVPALGDDKKFIESLAYICLNPGEFSKASNGY